jgi:aconitase A
MQIDLLPRGSGNRNFARRLADAFNVNQQLAPHIVKASAGASKVVVHFRPSLDLMTTIYGMKIREMKDEQNAADPDQLLLTLG